MSWVPILPNLNQSIKQEYISAFIKRYLKLIMILEQQSEWSFHLMPYCIRLLLIVTRQPRWFVSLQAIACLNLMHFPSNEADFATHCWHFLAWEEHLDVELKDLYKSAPVSCTSPCHTNQSLFVFKTIVFVCSRPDLMSCREFSSLYLRCGPKLILSDEC